MANASEVRTACEDLKKFWDKRNDAFKRWYKLIQMIDELAQKGMESFVGNEPMSAYSFIMSMLDQDIPHRILPEDLTKEQVAPASDLAGIYKLAWRDVHRSYRLRGRYFLRDLIGFLLATGWYSVFATITLDGSRCVAEVWNPASVFPSWDDVMVECAHIFHLEKAQAKRMAARNGWSVKEPRGRVNVYDYWRTERAASGKDVVFNSIVFGDDLVKNDVQELRFSRIPIFVAPVAGLPDTGELSSGRDTERWKGEIGRGFPATNENIYRYWNKWWTFSMQLLRDTAQPRTYEKTASARQIVKPEDWYKRGAHYNLGLQDEIGFITPPSIPVELRSTQLDMEAMMQRGGPSWAALGAVQSQATAYVMSQISAGANQVAKPYHEGLVDCLGDIDNFWYELARDNGYSLYGKALPDGLPDAFEVSASYELRIPGDFVQRVTSARIANPSFELSDEKVVGELFPEIQSPTEEMAKVLASKARRHPIHTSIALVASFNKEAALLRKAGDTKSAELYEKAATMVEASLEALPEAEETGMGA